MLWWPRPPDGTGRGHRRTGPLSWAAAQSPGGRMSTLSGCCMLVPMRPPVRHQSQPGSVQPGELCFSSNSEMNPHCALDQLLCSPLPISVSPSVQWGWGTRQRPNIIPDLGWNLLPWQRVCRVLTTGLPGNSLPGSFKHTTKAQVQALRF